MYARLFTFHALPENQDKTSAIADRLAEITPPMKGFISATYLALEDKTQFGAFSVWETKEDSENYAQQVQQEIGPQLMEVLQGPPQESLFEVYKAV